MSTVTRKFHMAHILSITTEYLIPAPGDDDYPMRTVRSILEFMANEPDRIDIFALPRVSDECRPYLLEQFPQLTHIDGKFLFPKGGDTPESVYKGRLKELTDKFGEWFEVRPIHPEDHQIISPAIELAMLAPHLEIISVKTDENGNISIDEENE